MTPKQKEALDKLRKLPPESRKKVAWQAKQLMALKPREKEFRSIESLAPNQDHTPTMEQDAGSVSECLTDSEIEALRQNLRDGRALLQKKFSKDKHFHSSEE